MKPTPTPWEIGDCIDGDNIKSFSLLDADGRVIVDTFNSEVAEIHSDHDEDARSQWDEQGRVNILRIKACVDACQGIENPEAVKDLVAACKRLVAEFEPEKMESVINDIANVLAKLEGKS